MVVSCLVILISLTEEDGKECDKNLGDNNLDLYDACKNIFNATKLTKYALWSHVR